MPANGNGHSNGHSSNGNGHVNVKEQELSRLRKASEVELSLAPKFDEEGNTVTLSRDRYEEVVGRLKRKAANYEYSGIALLVLVILGGAMMLAMSYWSNQISKESHIISGQIRWVMISSILWVH